MQHMHRASQIVAIGSRNGHRDKMYDTIVTGRIKKLTRTTESVLGATMVLGVIVLSPYALFVRTGCGCPQPRHDAVVPEPLSPAGDDPVTDETRPASQMDALASDTEPPLGPRACFVPDVEIDRTEGCDTNEPYPGCRWALPDPPEQGATYEIWRYSGHGARWGRPALVSLVLAAAHRYADETGGERITVGDLDAPGERHRTHDRGVDVDLYLPAHMATKNMGKSVFVDNYAGKDAGEVQKSRDRVLLLARILAQCASGRLRIYYNDPPVIESFLSWFEDQGLSTPFGAPMVPHNELHLFHFHVTIPDDLEIVPGQDG